MPFKNIAVKVKATAEDNTALADGQFVALASVFNNVDAYGDVVMPGAFADDLAAWKESGDSIPLYWGHRMDDPAMCVGAVVEATETAEGLQVTAQLDLDTVNGSQVYRLLKGRRVTRMSFAYDVLDGGWGERDDQQVYELRKLKVHEVSVVQVPANPLAVVQDVKAARVILADALAAKAGRVLSAKNEDALKSALSSIQSVLDSINDNSNDDGKASPTRSAAPEEPDGAKGDAPATNGSVSDAGLRIALGEIDAEALSLTDDIWE